MPAPKLSRSLELGWDPSRNGTPRAALSRNASKRDNRRRDGLLPFRVGQAVRPIHSSPPAPATSAIHCQWRSSDGRRSPRWTLFGDVGAQPVGASMTAPSPTNQECGCPWTIGPERNGGHATVRPPAIAARVLPVATWCDSTNGIWSARATPSQPSLPGSAAAGMSTTFGTPTCMFERPHRVSTAQGSAKASWQTSGNQARPCIGASMPVC